MCGAFFVEFRWIREVARQKKALRKGRARFQHSVQRLKLGGLIQWPNLLVPVGEKPIQVNIHPAASSHQEGQDCRHDAINLTGPRKYVKTT